MSAPSIAHTLVAAHADRVPELARLYGLLERAVATNGVDGDAAKEAHRALSARIAEWEVVDMEAERQDVASLTPPERQALLRSIARALPYAERRAEGRQPTAAEHDVVSALRRFQASFPTTLPRAALVRLRRSARRLERLEILRAPEFVLGREAEVLLAALESGTAPVTGEPRGLFDPDRGFQGTFIWGLEACVIREPGAAGAVDLGLGTSPAPSALLGVPGADARELDDRWVQIADPPHPFGRYPYVPRGRFCHVSPKHLVRADLDGTGPVGWAAGDDVAALARDFSVVAGDQPAFASDVQSVSTRVERAARDGYAIIGLIEYLPREADGERTWLVAPEQDRAG